MKQLKSLAILLLLSLMVPLTALADSFKVTPADLELGKQATLQFVLENTASYYGFQAEVKLPEGLTAVASTKLDPKEGEVDFTLTSRADGGKYELNSNTFSNGGLIIGAFTTNKTAFSGNDGALAELKVEVSNDFKGGEVALSNIIFIGEGNTDVDFEPTSTTLGIALTGFTLSEAQKELKVGESFTLTTTFTPENATNKEVEWKSSDEDVATVVDGKVTAVGIGTATITATCGDFTETCEVTVVATLVESISFTRTSLTLKPGGSTTLVAKFNPETATDTSVSWTSSKPEIATVDETGLVTAVSDGVTTITATSNSNPDATVSCVVTVKSDVIDVTGISLDREELSLIIGQNGTLTATVTPTNATDSSVHWDSSKPTVASVDEEGNITALAEGTTVITAEASNGMKASCTVTVKPVVATSVTVTADKSELKVGETLTLTASVLPENTTDKTIVWTSDDETVATVKDGEVTAIALGEATITAACGEVSGTFKVTVVPTPVESITLDNSELSLTEGESTTLTASISPEDATDKSVTWTSSDEAIATVDADGMVTAVKAGTATITVTTVDGEFTASCAVTVEAAPVAVTGITLSKTAATLTEGESLNLVATVAPTDATDKSFTWSSSDETVATVASNGKVTALKAGSVTITATSNANTAISASCVVTVTTKDSDEVFITWPMAVKTDAGYSYDFTPIISDGVETITAGEPVLGTEIAWKEARAVNGVPFAIFQPSAKVTKVTEGHTVTFSVEVPEGYTFQPTGFNYIASVIGTDGGNYDLNYTWNGKTVELQNNFNPNRNNEAKGWFSQESVSITDAAAANGKFEVTFSVYNLANNKQIGLSDVVIKGKLVKDTSDETIAVESVALDQSLVVLKNGESVTLNATVSPEDATDKTVTWSTSNDKVATVDQTGKVTAVGCGDATITAKAGDVSAECIIAISYPEEEGYIYSRTPETWTSADLADWIFADQSGNSGGTQSIDSALKLNGTNTGWTSTKDVTFSEYSIVTLNATIHGGAATGRSGSYDFLKLGDVEIKLNGQDKTGTVVIGESTTNLNGYTRDADYDITIVINQATKDVTVTVAGGATCEATGKLSDPLPGNVVVGHYKAGKENYEVIETLKTIRISEELQDVTTASYTVNYIYDGTTIKSEEGTIAVGAEVKADSPLTVDGQKYYLADDATSSMIIEFGSENILNVEMRKAYVYNYTVENNVNSDIKSGTCEEGESVTVAYNKYILKDGTVYTKAANSQQYTYTFTPESDNEVVSLEYTATDITDAIYFVEGEDIEGMTPTKNGNAGVRASNALGGYSAVPVTFYTLSPGQYIISIANSGSADKVMTIKAGEETVHTATTNGSWTEFVSEEFELTTETELTFEGAADGYPLDYILIRKTGEYVPVSGIKLNKNSLELRMDDETKLSATVTPADASHENVIWTSSDEEVVTIDAEGNVKAIGIGAAVITAHCYCGEETADCAVKVYPKLGDANWDGEIDITDAVDITNYVVEKKTVADEDLEYYVKGANANGDEAGNITVADAAATVSIILAQENVESTQTRVRAYAEESADALVIGNASATSYGTVIPVALDNTMEYVALQADIILPEGMSVDVKEGSRIAGSHILMTKKHTDNHIRVALFSLANCEFAADEAPILEIITDSNVSASDVVISNIIASDTDANGYVLGAKIGTATAVASIGLDENAPVKVFDVNGMFVSDSLEGLHQGTYIIRQGENSKKVYLR